MGLGAPEIIIILLALILLTSPVICGIIGYQAGSKRSIGGVAGLFLGIFLSFIGLIFVFCSRKVIEDPFHNYVSPVSHADELKKYKHLLDSGAITEEEYNDQKAKILRRV